jgi:hypothetical protein
MSKLIVDETLREKLNGLNEDIELCDPTGQTLGHFVPTEVYKKLLYTWLKAQITDEELERLKRQTGGRPLAEIWQRLGQA